MSANFYELLKYAATGIASPDMTYYDRMRASTLMGGAVQTLTGQPPLTFKADGTPLISWSMKGNGQQTGTPTPDNPVMPEFVGVRTGNLYVWPYTSTWGVDGSGQNRTVYNSAITRSSVVKLKPNTQYTISAKAAGSSDTYCRIAIFDEEPQIGSVSTHYYFSIGDGFTTFTTGADEEWAIVAQNNGAASNTDLKRMLNEGTTALPYEPFGYKIHITCAGQTVPVYLGQVSTVRKILKLVLTGDENWGTTGSSGHSFRLVQSDIRRADAQDVIAPIMSTHYTGISFNAVYNGTANGIGVPSTATWIAICDRNISGVDTFKQFLAAQYAAGNPVTVWYVLAEPTTGIVNEPLAKIGNYADELSSEDAGVSIPTVKGQNTLTVDTDLQPSEMSITYKG